MITGLGVEDTDTPPAHANAQDQRPGAGRPSSGGRRGAPRSRGRPAGRPSHRWPPPSGTLPGRKVPVAVRSGQSTRAARVAVAACLRHRVEGPPGWLRDVARAWARTRLRAVDCVRASSSLVYVSPGDLPPGPNGQRPQGRKGRIGWGGLGL
ncbi:hypothetical protein ABZP36_018612 [Zizania latifolia]